MPEINFNQIDEMIDHLRVIKRECGTDRAVLSALAIGFFLETLKDEMTENIPKQDDEQDK